jgi:peptide/nickel transport system substrate-binding protein
MANGLSGRKLLAAGLLAAAVIAVLALWGRERLEAPAPGQAGGAPPAELVATVRSEPRSFNRLVARDRTSHLVSLLTQARLVRIDLETQELEPALAERWASSPDGLEYTLTLRRDVRFSDGTPMTAADVLFSAEALYDERVGSPIAEPLKPGGQPLVFSAPDDHTVVVKFPVPFGPGLRILDNLPILPKHKLQAALREGKFRDAWGVSTPTTELAGLGPFVIESYRPGERLVFARNPHYWRTGPRGERLPLLDRLVVSIVPDQNAEILRLQSGQADLTNSEVRPDDLAAVRRAADEGRLVVSDLGVGLDPDCLWFNLRPAFARANPGRQWLQRRELRRAVSMAVDRAAFADTVFLGTAVPVGGPVTPGNRAWFDPAVVPPPHDPAQARRLLAEMGLRDADGDGTVDAPGGGPARFTLLTQKGNTLRERGAVFVQEELRKVGLDVAVVTLEQPAVIDRLMKGDYEAIYFGPQILDTDPAANLDFWLSSGAFHLWNPAQDEPATAWERQIDDLMRAQLAARDPAERRRLFGEVQRIFADEAPAIYFVAPRIHVAMSPRVAGARPALLQPPILWNADHLAVR